jgi:hypothetical protein
MYEYIEILLETHPVLHISRIKVKFRGRKLFKKHSESNGKTGVATANSAAVQLTFLHF